MKAAMSFGWVIAVIIGVIAYRKTSRQATVIKTLQEQCREKDSEIQRLNKKCSTLTKENELLNKEILKHNPQWQLRNLVANLRNKASYKVDIDD